MTIIEIILIAIGLSMDAFAVAIIKGLSMPKMSYKKAMIIAFYFGIFQGIMPLIGYFLGTAFYDLVESIDHWIAFILLAVIGINMIRESFQDDNDNINDKTDFKTMILLAIATSIDALAVGISLAMVRNINIFVVVTIIAIITFTLSLIGVKIGNLFGDKFNNKAELIGGCILIIIGLKILLEHLYG